MLPGYTLRNRYKIVKLLGSGAFGITYLAQDLDLPDHPLCVVKNLKESQNQQELKDFIAFFNKEAKALYRLGNKCDQIPQLFAHFEEEGKFYLVQEYVDGHDLSQEIKAGNQLSEAEVTQLLKDILEVLSYIHDQNIIHRDLKAQNLMRRHSDGKIVLIDFGTVKELSKLKANPQELTNASVMIGTVGYMPNEQLNGYPKLSSDIYAVGMLGIYALTGIRPQDLPKDSDTFEVAWQHFVSVSPEFANILNKMVRSNFKERYQNANEALQALQISSESTARTLRVAPASLHISSPPSFPIVNSRFFISLGVIFSVILGIGWLFTVFSRKSEPEIVDAQTCLDKLNLQPIENKSPDAVDNKGNKLYKFYGEIKNEKLSGCGALISKVGNKSQGIFEDSKLNGKGIILYADGKQYQGEFKNGNLHGQGILTYPNDSQYQGEFKNGNLHGQGILTYPNTSYISKYQGGFRNGKPYGKASLIFKQNDKKDRFEREYIDGSRDIGILTFKNEEYYIQGAFINKYQDGEGTIFYNNGCIYKGEFKTNKPHGQGSCKSNDGASQTGNWKEGKLEVNNKTCCDYTY
ncbi:protein kinase domain-containing protein [Rivularia sp. UHCC 0363]|uniref:protein kinase domain-containing protein n=1 Tax=Rivularia sp. UHCC 0363 TaxID=3110244 RepID=UPI002B201840|nr:protein kinase [Rivularia sp. UHCC 0363]MEA5597117.1 protein kinase [Rivularia sp. UHCC 0363]